MNLYNSAPSLRFWSHPDPTTIEDALLCTLAYADLFDYPLTVDEVHRYLVGTDADLAAVKKALHKVQVFRSVVRDGDYFMLAGREGIVQTRLERARAAAALWPVAVGHGRAIARLPFVRMVAVTGALAVDNPERGDDIDYLIVTEPDRLWLCRAVIIQFVVKPAARRGITICPNYLVSERALSHFDRNLFTAHEIVQMVPVAGTDTYERLRTLNPWVAIFLPNACSGVRSMTALGDGDRSRFRWAESFLASNPGQWLEQWERKRKIDRFEKQRRGDSDASFTRDVCKGHFGGHSLIVRARFVQQMQALGLGTLQVCAVSSPLDDVWSSV